MQRALILYYTDCFVFGGCEKPAYEVISSEKFNEKYEYKIFYRYSREYCEGRDCLFPGIDKERIKGFRFPDPSSAGYYFRRRTKNPLALQFLRYSYAVLMRLLVPFTFAYEVSLLAAAFARERTEVVHINNGGYPGALSCRAAAVAARLCGKKHVILSVHNMAVPERGIFERAVDLLVRRSVDMFITASKASGRALAENRGFDREKVLNIYHGIADLREKTPASDILPAYPRGFACMIARFEERKGHRHVVSAWHEMIQEKPECAGIKLVLIGDGPLLQQVKDLVAKKGLSGNIEILGHRNDYLSYLKSCMFLLNPSLGYEDMPLIILEAMSLGIPVIGTDVAGIPEEIEDGVNGMIVPPGDEGRLKDAMKRLISEPSLRDSFGRSGRQRFVDGFTLNGMVDKYVGLYDSLS